MDATRAVLTQQALDEYAATEGLLGIGLAAESPPQTRARLDRLSATELHSVRAALAVLVRAARRRAGAAPDEPAPDA